VVALADAAADVLARDDLTHEQRVEIAEELSTRYVSFSWSSDGSGIDVNVQITG
jgi:hypothetical protein